jgi:hypothetical protein
LSLQISETNFKAVLFVNNSLNWGWRWNILKHNITIETIHYQKFYHNFSLWIHYHN